MDHGVLCASRAHGEAQEEAGSESETARLRGDDSEGAGADTSPPSGEGHGGEGKVDARRLCAMCGVLETVAMALHLGGCVHPAASEPLPCPQ